MSVHLQHGRVPVLIYVSSTWMHDSVENGGHFMSAPTHQSYAEFKAPFAEAVFPVSVRPHADLLRR